MKRVGKALGFTLMEVLIAMTLLSVMVVVLFASLRICAQSWEKGESKMADVNEVATVYHFFQQHLSSAKPLWDDFTVQGQKTLAFQGDAQSLQFVGEFPASAGKVGAQLFSLQLKELDDDRFINVSLKPFLPLSEDQLLSTEEVTLIKHVKGVSLAYFGPDESRSEEGSWQTEWLQRDSQPQLVKIGIELDNGMYWPDMIVELKIANTSANSENGLGAGEQDEDNVQPDESMQEEVE
jgi:general secretion pathway protein J